MRKKLINKLKAQDEFGHKVELNFNGNEGSVHSLPGGISSILLRIFYFLLMVKKLDDMFFYKDDQVMNNNTKADFDAIGSIELNDLGGIPIFTFEYGGKGTRADKQIDSALCKGSTF